jgi:hypothetical protein
LPTRGLRTLIDLVGHSASPPYRLDNILITLGNHRRYECQNGERRNTRLSALCCDRTYRANFLAVTVVIRYQHFRHRGTAKVFLGFNAIRDGRILSCASMELQLLPERRDGVRYPLVWWRSRHHLFSTADLWSYFAIPWWVRRVMSLTNPDLHSTIFGRPDAQAQRIVWRFAPRASAKLTIGSPFWLVIVQ